MYVSLVKIVNLFLKVPTLPSPLPLEPYQQLHAYNDCGNYTNLNNLPIPAYQEPIPDVASTILSLRQICSATRTQFHPTHTLPNSSVDVSETRASITTPCTRLHCSTVLGRCSDNVRVVYALCSLSDSTKALCALVTKMLGMCCWEPGAGGRGATARW